MPGSSCHFCAQANPADSKFCNRCGEPLDLKPCTHCDAMSHVAVDRCWQCGALFTPETAVLEVAEVAVGTIAEATPSRRERVTAPRAPRIEPSLGPLERIPVALSDRMEASTERVAAPFNDAPPLQPFAEAALNSDTADDDWVDPRRAQAARQGLRMRRRSRAAYAALAAAVLCVIAAGGFYAYDAGFVSRAADWARATERGVSASSAAMLAAMKRDVGVATRASPRSSTPATTATPAPDQPAASDAHSETAASSPLAPKRAESSAAASVSAILPSAASPSTSTTPQPTQAPAPPATEPAAAQAAAAAAPALRSAPARTAKAAPPSTVSSVPAPAPRARKEASRRPPRETPPKTPRTEAAQPALNKDALATQRLIQRDLAGFLPPEQGQTPAAR
jgi:hypothetical protein